LRRTGCIRTMPGTMPWMSALFLAIFLLIPSLTAQDEGVQSGSNLEVISDTPSVTTFAEPSEIASGSSYRFTAQNLSSEDLAIEWRASHGSPLSASGKSLHWTAPAVDSAQTVTIALTLTNTEGCSKTNVVNLVVVPRSLAKIGLIKDCQFEAPARIAGHVLYTYNITNLGDVSLYDINLTDTQSWGPDCQPVYESGDDGDGILEPGESWWYECNYTISDPDDSQILRIMQDSSSSTDIPKTIERLLEMKARLEIMMDRERQSESQFDEQRAVLTKSYEIIEEKGFTNYSYINEVTGESISRIIDSNGTLNKTMYYDPIAGAVLTRMMSPSGKILSEEIYYPPPGTKEDLKIEYDKPAKGYRTYTITDFKTGDTLILVIDKLGNILKKDYRVTPGYMPYEEKYFLKNTATVTAKTAEGKYVESYDSFTLEVFRPGPIMTVEKIPEEITANPDDFLNYTITYQNVGLGDAQNVLVMETYDEELTFLWSDPAPDPGTNNEWTIKGLKAGELGVIWICAKVKPDAAPGSVITNTVDVISSTEAEETVNTTVSETLNITKEASSDILSQNESFTYTIKYSNDGEDALSEVIVHDWLDKNVDFISYVANPPLDFTQEGEHLKWQCGDLQSGSGGTIVVKAKVRAKENMTGHGNATSIINRYRIDSALGTGRIHSLETLIVKPLWINKTSDKALYNRDENITYTIRYGNAHNTSVDNVSVTDILPQVDFVSAYPPPDNNINNSNNLTWTVGVLDGKETGKITLIVHIPKKPTAKYEETSLVQGEGYSYIRKGFSTEEERDSLINTVKILGYYNQTKPPITESSKSVVTIAGYAGTTIKSAEHGSGQYREESQSSLNQENKSISLHKDLSATFKTTDFSLPQNRSIRYNSTWSEHTRTENRILGDIISEEYLYAQVLNKNSSVHADLNETVFKSESDFTSGLASMSYKKQPYKSTTIMQEIDESYHGTFRISEGLDSYGESVKFSDTATGKGFSSSDIRVAGLQRSYASGSGYYSSEEEAQLGSIDKQTKALYAPTYVPTEGRNISYSGLWSEGLSTAEPEKGNFIQEKISQAVSIDQEASMDKTSLSILGKFNGTQELKVESGPEMGVEQTLKGSFLQDTSISIYSAPRHLYPHVNVSQNATMLDMETVLFWINVSNDGNKKLSRINVTDYLPAGLTFINSSLKAKANGQMINWSIPSLEISRTLTIKLRAKVEGENAGYINLVKVRTVSGEEVLEAECSLAFLAHYQPLPCCLENMTAINASWIFNATTIRDNWGEWNPSPCFNISGNTTECSALSDAYYDELEKNAGDCCASNYEVP